MWEGETEKGGGGGRERLCSRVFTAAYTSCSNVEKIYRQFAAREDARSGGLLRNPTLFRIFEPWPNRSP